MSFEQMLEESFKTVRNGEVVDKMVGGYPKPDIVAKIEANL